MIGKRLIKHSRVGYLCVVLLVVLFVAGCSGFKVVRIPIPIPTFGLGSGGEKSTSKTAQAPKAGNETQVSKGQMVGIASWYGRKFHRKQTASGEIYDMYADTAAHPSLPFGTRVRVTNLENRRSAVVRINDRGPFKKDRIIDVSYGVARKLDFVERGIVQVKLEIL